MQPAVVFSQERLDSPVARRVVEVQTIPALADYARARAAESRGDQEAALVNYRQILPYATDPAVASQIFRTALVVGDTSTALAVIRPFPDMADLPMEAPLLRIAAAIRTNDWVGARQLTDALGPDGMFAFLAPSIRAWIAVGQRETDPLHYLDGLERGSLQHSYAQRTRALLTALQGSRADALAVARSPNMSGLDSVMVRLALADRLLSLGAKDDAVKLLEGSDPLIAAARLSAESGRKIGSSASTSAEGVALLFSDMAAELAQEKVTSLSLKLQRIAHFLAPDNVVSPIVLANYLAAEFYGDLALKTLGAVKRNSPFYEAARMQRVAILVEQGKKADAEITAREWTKAEPRSQAAWEAMGNALLASGDNAGAIKVYQKQLALMPEGSKSQWRPHFLIGNAERDGGRWQFARSSYQAALALAPKEGAVLNALGYGMILNGEDSEKAIGYLRTARMNDPGNPVYADSLGWAYVLSGDPARGAAVLESAVKLAPGDPVFNEHLGDAYWLGGRKVEARYSWAAARVYADPQRQMALDARLKDGPPSR